MNGKLKALDLLEIKDIAPRCENDYLVQVVSGDSLVGKAGTQGIHCMWEQTAKGWRIEK